MSPPSRFVRVFFLRQYALADRPPTSFSKTLVLALELYTSLYKIRGTLRDPVVDPLEMTSVSTRKVPCRRLVYIPSREKMTWVRH